MLVPVLIQVKRECESAINNSINRSRPRDRDQIEVQMPLTNSWEGCTSGETLVCKPGDLPTIDQLGRGDLMSDEGRLKKICLSAAVIFPLNRKTQWIDPMLSYLFVQLAKKGGVCQRVS